jgi:hypothetical protein
MRYLSTRGEAAPRGFEDVLLAGLAEDGGLFLPETWPSLSPDEWRALRGLPYAELATRLLLPFMAWLVLYALAVWYFVPRLGHVARAQADARSLMTGRVTDAYTNIATVKLFSHAGREAGYVKSAMQEFMLTVHQQMRLSSAFEVINHLLSMLLIISTAGVALLVRVTPVTSGALFAAVSDTRYKRFAESYETRFGTKPYRIATLGYDAVLLTLRVAREWKVGNPFPKGELYDRGGFLGVDGPFRFNRSGIADRALEVREVRGGEVVSVDPAPTGFGG